MLLFIFLYWYFSCQQGEKPLNKESRKGLFYNVKLNSNRKIHIFTIISLKLMKVQNKVSQYLTLFSDIFYFNILVLNVNIYNIYLFK